MADHRGGPGVTGTRLMHRGRFVQHHRIPLENPTVTLTQEGGLFLPERDTSGLKEVRVFFPLSSRTASVLQRKGNGFSPTSTSSCEVYSPWCIYEGLLLATAKPTAPALTVRE